MVAAEHRALRFQARDEGFYFEEEFPFVAGLRLREARRYRPLRTARWCSMERNDDSLRKGAGLERDS